MPSRPVVPMNNRTVSISSVLGNTSPPAGLVGDSATPDHASPFDAFRRAQNPAELPVSSSLPAPHRGSLGISGPSPRMSHIARSPNSGSPISSGGRRVSSASFVSPRSSSFTEGNMFPPPHPGSASNSGAAQTTTSPLRHISSSDTFEYHSSSDEADAPRENNLASLKSLPPPLPSTSQSPSSSTSPQSLRQQQQQHHNHRQPSLHVNISSGIHPDAYPASISPHASTAINPATIVAVTNPQWRSRAHTSLTADSANGERLTSPVSASGASRFQGGGSSYLEFRRKQAFSTPDIDSYFDPVTAGANSTPRQRLNIQPDLPASADHATASSRKIKHGSFIETRPPPSHAIGASALSYNAPAPLTGRALVGRANSIMAGGDSSRPTPIPDRLRTNAIISPYSQRVQELQQQAGQHGERNSFATVSSLSNFTMDGESWMNRHSNAALDDSQLYAHTPARMGSTPTPATHSGGGGSRKHDAYANSGANATAGILHDSPMSISERLQQLGAYYRAPNYAPSEPAASETYAGRIRSRANSRARPDDVMSDAGLWTTPKRFSEDDRATVPGDNSAPAAAYLHRTGVARGAPHHQHQHQPPLHSKVSPTKFDNSLTFAPSDRRPSIASTIVNRTRRYSFGAVTSQAASAPGGTEPALSAGASANPSLYPAHRRGNSNAVAHTAGDVLAGVQNPPRIRSPASVPSAPAATSPSYQKAQKASKDQDTDTPYYDVRAQGQKVQELLQENFDLRIRNKILTEALDETNSDSIQKLANDYERACKANRKANEEIKRLLEKVRALSNANESLKCQVQNPPPCPLNHGMSEEERATMQRLEDELQQSNARISGMEANIMQLNQDLSVQEESCNQLQRDLAQEKENAENWRQLALQRQQHANHSFTSTPPQYGAYHRASPDFRGGSSELGFYRSRTATGATSDTLGNHSEGSEADWNDRSPRHISNDRAATHYTNSRGSLYSSPSSFMKKVTPASKAIHEHAEALERQVIDLQEQLSRERTLVSELRETRDANASEFRQIEKKFEQELHNFKEEIAHSKDVNAALMADYDELCIKYEQALQEKNTLEEQLAEIRRCHSTDNDESVADQHLSLAKSKLSDATIMTAEMDVNKNESNESASKDNTAYRHIVAHLRAEIGDREQKIADLEESLTQVNGLLKEERARFNLQCQELFRSCLREVVVTPDQLEIVETRLRELQYLQSTNRIGMATPMHAIEDYDSGDLLSRLEGHDDYSDNNYSEDDDEDDKGEREDDVAIAAAGFVGSVVGSDSTNLPGHLSSAAT
ncbi:hypothetical protein EV182_000490 [Spiromyces aspiralis]|uniref:Uncharacterized protein n=1 Tax=Spiromyces aspiralis TaxID=68401 RepID=A0ACC1HXZ4_9FUNG|nr:hypothetical protein EV182_000490 [Spiromyces aspiralis]